MTYMGACFANIKICANKSSHNDGILTFVFDNPFICFDIWALGVFIFWED